MTASRGRRWEGWRWLGSAACRAAMSAWWRLSVCANPRRRLARRRREISDGSPRWPACGGGRAVSEYDHVWRWRSRLGERKGQGCRVIARGAMNAIFVEFTDGYRAITSRFAVRLVRER